MPTIHAIDLSSGITTGAVVVVVIGKEPVVEVVVLISSVASVVVVVVSPIVIEPSTNFTLEVIFTPFSALTTVSDHETGNLPVVPAGISTVSVAKTSPSFAVAPFTVAKR